MGSYSSTEVALTPATKEMWKKRPATITYPHEKELAAKITQFRRIGHLVGNGRS